MLVTVFIFIFTVLGVLAARYLVVKTKLTEKSIDDAISRRMRTSPAMLEMRNLHEMNGVMRNLLIDLVETDELASRAGGTDVTPGDKRRLLALREARRREVCAETIVFLKQTGGLPASTKTSKTKG